MKLIRCILLYALAVLSVGSAHAADIVVPVDQLHVERFIPLDQLANYPGVDVVVPQAVDPLAVYSNVTAFSGQAFAQGPAAAGFTRLVMDDLTFTTNADVGAVSTLRFSVANLNGVAHSVRARLRIWNADGASLGAGLPNGPGTYYSPGGTAVGFSFSPFTFGVGVTTLTGTAAFALPAGGTNTLWFGLTFDNVGTTTGATDTDLSNFGQAFFTPVDLGSSTDTIFETTATGSFFPTNSPAGAAVNFAGSPAARQGWEIVVASLGTPPVVNADLSITKTDGVSTATPGGSLTYVITASNAGPAGVTGATVADTFPVSETCTWTCSGAGGGTCSAAGSGNINDVVNLPSGSSVIYTASCAISAAATGTLSNGATITEPAGVTDPMPGNNVAIDTDTLVASADLAITKTDGVSSVSPGGSVTYAITASNAGPSNANGATVSDTFPASETCSWTCGGAAGGTCTAAGSGNINDTVNLPSGGSVVYTASCTISGAATGSISNTATVAAPVGVSDPNSANDSATDTDTVVLTADLSITKTDGVTTVAPGGTLTYTIVGSNTGPQAVDASIQDKFPGFCSSVSWTCVAAGGAVCASSGNFAINEINPLPAGSSVTYSATCTVDLAAPNGTVISNTAIINPDSGTDPVPDNNSATDTTTVAALPAINGSKTVTGSFTQGGAITYTIVLSNSGTGAQADNAGDEFVDVLPAGLTLVSASTTSGTVVANGGANTVTWNGTIAAGASTTITINATINGAAIGNISNQGTVNVDADGNGSNETPVLTDDPSQGGAANPTTFAIVVGEATAVPSAGLFALIALTVLVLGAGIRRRFV